jgi:hypothetical protein
MSIRSLFILALSLTLAACATSATNILTQDKRDALRIDLVEVTFTSDAKIDWSDALGAAPEEPAARRAFLERKAIGPIKTALDAEIIPAFRGTDPAKLKVRIRNVSIPALALQVILGSGGYAIKADIELVDAKTGKTLLEAPDFNGLAASHSGVLGVLEAAVADEPIIRVSKAFAQVLKTWLKTGEAFAQGRWTGF